MNVVAKDEEGNPTLAEEETPVAVVNAVDLHVQQDGSSWQACKGGTVFLTSQRLIVLHGSGSLAEFQCKLSDMEGRSFEQPVFGSNHIAARVPLPTNPTPGGTGEPAATTTFASLQLHFPHGGSDAFFTHLIETEAQAKKEAARATSSTNATGSSSAEPHGPSPSSSTAASRQQGAVPSVREAAVQSMTDPLRVHVGHKKTD